MREKLKGGKKRERAQILNGRGHRQGAMSVVTSFSPPLPFLCVSSLGILDLRIALITYLPNGTEFFSPPPGGSFLVEISDFMNHTVCR